MKDFGSNTFYSAKYDDQFEHAFKTFTAIQAESLGGRFHVHPSIYWNRSMDRFGLFRGTSDKYPFSYYRTGIYGVNLSAHFDWNLGRTASAAELHNEDLASGNLGEPLSRPRHIHGTDRDYTVRLNRTNIQFVLEHNIILDRFMLSTGLTIVEDSQADMPMYVYPGVDASYRVRNAWELYAFYNSSLRMPPVTELFYSVGGHKADKHLRPEEFSVFETGTKYSNKDIAAKASVYWSNHKSLINQISDGILGANGAVLWKSADFERTKRFGAEVLLDFDLYQLLPSQRFFKKFGVTYSYIHQRKVDNQGYVSKYALEYLKNEFIGNLQLDLWRSLDFGFYYRFQHRAGNYIDTSNQLQSYKSYGVVDSRMSWKASTWTACVEADNLFGARCIGYGNVPQPGAWVVAGISLNLWRIIFMKKDIFLHDKEYFFS